MKKKTRAKRLAIINKFLNEAEQAEKEKTALQKDLTIQIPEKPQFYSLYAQGIFDWKSFDNLQKQTVLSFSHNAVIALYYTYPSYREADVIRNSANGSASLPGLSHKVELLFSVRASRVDKLRRALSFLNANTQSGAYSFDDDFYTALYFLLLQRGKINYPALRKLAQIDT